MKVLLALTQGVCSRLCPILQHVHKEQGQTTLLLWLTKVVAST